MSRRTARILELTLVGLVAALVGAQLVLYAPGLHPSIAVTDHLTLLSNQTVEVRSSIEATFDAHISLVGLDRTSSGGFPVVGFYYDPAYPASYSDIPDWYGLYNHLAAVAAARGISLPFQFLSAPELRSFLADPSTHGDLLIMASGVLPDTVYYRSVNLLAPWLAGGGTLLWSGDQIGAYSGHPHERLNPGAPDNPGLNGTAGFIPRGWLGGGGARLYGNPSPIANSLGVDYPYSIPNNGLRLTNLSRAGGEPLGWIQGGFTNVARIPEGNGSLIYFSGPSFDVIRLSFAILNLYAGGAIDGSATILDAVSAIIHARTPLVVDRWVPLPAAATPPDSFCELTLQTDYLSTFVHQACAVR